MMEAAVAVASWHSAGALTRKRQRRRDAFKAGRDVAVLHAATLQPGRTWTGPWAGRVGVAEAEPAGPPSACWGRAGALDV